MKLKRSLLLSVLCMATMKMLPDNYSLTNKEQQQILEEAENWIDDMPDGLQDRLSDAVKHAVHGFYSEISYFRNIADTTEINKYKVKVNDIAGGSLGEINMRLYSASDNQKTPLLIYFHGGGWSVGSLETSDKFCRALASEGNIKVISVDYPLAPENPFPSAIKYCLDAVEYINGQCEKWNVESNKISLGGDGAGGNLAIEVYSRLSDNIKINSMVLYYPLLQTSGSLDPQSKREYGRGYGFDSRLWEAFKEAYKGSDTRFPDSLPRVLLISAGRDIIIEEEKTFSSSYDKLTYIQFDGALHGFLSDGHQKTAFKKAVAITDQFLTY